MYVVAEIFNFMTQTGLQFFGGAGNPTKITCYMASVHTCIHMCMIYTVIIHDILSTLAHILHNYHNYISIIIIYNVSNVHNYVQCLHFMIPKINYAYTNTCMYTHTQACMHASMHVLHTHTTIMQVKLPIVNPDAVATDSEWTLLITSLLSGLLVCLGWLCSLIFPTQWRWLEKGKFGRWGQQ